MINDAKINVNECKLSVSLVNALNRADITYLSECVVLIDLLRDSLTATQYKMLRDCIDRHKQNNRL